VQGINFRTVSQGTSNYRVRERKRFSCYINISITLTL